MRKFKVNAAALVVFILMLLIIRLSSAQEETHSTLSSDGVISYITNIPGWLHVSGENIYDSNNNLLKIRMAQAFSGGGEGIYLSDIQKIRSFGFNAIRLALPWRRVQPLGPDSVDTTFFTQTNSLFHSSVDSIVNWTASNGMYILLEPIWTPSHPVPTWAISVDGQGITEGDCNIPTPPRNTISDLFHNDTVAQGVYYMYRWMAAHYATQSNVMFESFNEWITTRGLGTDGGALYQNFNDGWVSAVEQGEGGNSHLKVIEYLWDLNWQYNLDRPPFISGTHGNVVMATHDYHSSLAILSTRTNSAHGVNRPIIDTEFSPKAIGGDWQSWLSTILQDYETVNYGGWSFYFYSHDPNFDSSWNINNDAYAAIVMPILSPYL